MADSVSLEQAVQAIQAGDVALAQKLLAQRLQADAKDDQAWYWMAFCVSEVEKKRYCLQKALALRPDYAQAQQALDELEGAGAEAGVVQSPEISPTSEAATPESSEAGEPSPPEAAVQPASPEEGGELSPEEAAAQAVPQADTGSHIAEEDTGQAATAEETGQAMPPEPASRPVPRKGSSKADRARPRRVSPAQAGCLVVLAATIVLALAALAFLAWQNGALAGLDRWSGYLPWLAATISPAQPGAEQAYATQPPLATIELPPTWTPAPSPSPTLPPIVTIYRPTATLPLTPTPVASITPFFGHWRIVIGRSVENKLIEVHRFGTGKKERMIVAGIHGGDEANTIALADQLIAYLSDRPQVIPKDVTLYILRSLNPDGEAAGTRLNANGVDLNRNFETNWKEAWKDDGCASPSGTAGQAAASEPETKALMAFLQAHPVQVLINYHSAGLGIFPAGSPPDPGSGKLAQAIANVSDYPYPPVNTGCEYTGTLVDWAVAHGVSAAVDVELNDKTSTEFETNLRILDLLLNWEAPLPPPTPTSLTPTVTGPVSPLPASPTLTVMP